MIRLLVTVAVRWLQMRHLRWENARLKAAVKRAKK
jgi:hypothetical protein